jgi:N-acetylmuramoyl-L-alanine amidase
LLVLVVACLFQASPAATQTAAGAVKRLVVIDAGMAEWTRARRGPGGTREKDVTLAVAGSRR